MATPLNLAARRKICQSSIAMSADIVAEEALQGATRNSTFITSQLPPLSSNESPNVRLKPIRVLNGDSLTIARDLAHSLADGSANTTVRRVAVLNLASDQLPGGGWPMTISTT